MELGIRARNFWHQGLDAFFDIRTDTNALSYKDLSIDTIFRKHESEKGIHLEGYGCRAL